MLARLTVLTLAVIGTLAASAPIEAKLQLAQGFGQRCQTPRGTCFLGAPLPIGRPCSCPAPTGPVPGVVI
jgi:hypothetical protein